MSGIIGLSGKAVGTVVVSFSKEVAIKAASVMLMMEATELDPELLSREQRQRLEQERLARVQREMAERVESDLRVLAIAVRDGVAVQAAGDASLCMLGPPLPTLAAAPPAALTAAVDALDRGRRYLRQYIRRDRVLFDVYGALQDTGRAAA